MNWHLIFVFFYIFLCFRNPPHATWEIFFKTGIQGPTNAAWYWTLKIVKRQRKIHQAKQLIRASSVCYQCIRCVFLTLAVGRQRARRPGGFIFDPGWRCSSRGSRFHTGFCCSETHPSWGAFSTPFHRGNITIETKVRRDCVNDRCAFLHKHVNKTRV